MKTEKIESKPFTTDIQMGKNTGNKKKVNR